MSRDKRPFFPVFPSILSTNFFDLEEKLSTFQHGGVDVIHLDIMDGNFVTNISFGPSASKAIKSRFDFKIDAHLMVDHPSEVIPWFMEAGADWISFHVETESDRIEKNIQLIKDGGCKAGLALNPDTPIDRLTPFLPALDYILVMSVFPGYGGQSFITQTYGRLTTLKNKLNELGLNPVIQVDGGVKTANLKALADHKVDSFVIGTYLFNSDNIAETLTRIIGEIE